MKRFNTDECDSIVCMKTLLIVFVAIMFVLVAGCTERQIEQPNPIATVTTVVTIIEPIQTQMPVTAVTDEWGKHPLKTATAFTAGGDDISPDWYTCGAVGQSCNLYEAQGNEALEMSRCMDGFGSLESCYKLADRKGMSRHIMKKMWCQTLPNGTEGC